MMLKFGVAKELGKTLQEIGEMTEQELIGWSAYFQVVNEEQEKEFENKTQEIVLISLFNVK